MNRHKDKENKKKQVTRPVSDNSGKLADIKKLNVIFMSIVFLLSFLLYSNTISNDYALDDIAVIQENKFTKQGFAGIDDMLHTFYWQGYWDLNAGLYRPLSLITFAIEYQFAGDNPHVSHFINVALYAVIACLLFFLLQHLLHKQHILLPLFSTLLFIAHPLHTEVVANIKSRDELLCFFFFLLSMIFLWRYIRTNKLSSIILALVWYFLSLFSKEGAVVFMAIIPLTIFFFTNETIKKTARISALFLIPAAIFLSVHTYVISQAPTEKITYSYLDNSLVAAPDLSSRLATAVYMMGQYFKLLVFPHPLSYDYSFNEVPISTWADWKVLLPLLSIGILIFIAIKKFRQKSLISYGILFFFITISLVSNIFMLIGATMADRFLFIPSFGFCLILSYIILQVTKTPSLNSSSKSWINKAMPAFIITGVILTLYSFKTISRNNDWENNFTLFKRDVNASPNSSRVQYNYGTELLNKFASNEKDTLVKNRLLDETIYHLEISAKIDKLSSQTFLNLASAYYLRKNYPKAVENAERCISLNDQDPKAYSVLGNAYYRLNNFDKAIVNLKTSIDKNFVSDNTYNFLGGAYFGKQDFQNAIDAFTKAIAMDSTNFNALINLGSAYGITGNFENSINTFRQFINRSADPSQGYYYLAITYQNMGLADSARIYQQKLEARQK